MKRFKFLWLAAVIMIGFVMPLNSYALSVNGLSVSNNTLTQGGEFEVNINIPANSENADTASIRVEFDSSAFEVKSWEPVVSGGTAGSGDGYFTIAAANAERKIDLSNGLTLTATLEVKNTAQNGSYDIKLTKNSLSYVADNGYDYIELWSPEVKTVSVTVDSESTVTPPTKDDITVSSGSLKPNDEFNVYINIPANSENADTASIKVEFDYSAFEVKSWEPVVSGATAGSGGGYFTLAAANAERKIDLSNGLTLTATLKVKSSAKSGDYDIKLTKSSLSYVTDNGYDYIELWSPEVKTVSVTVDSEPTVTPPTKDDITVSSGSLKPNDEFNVYINIPANSENADTASIKVEFDHSAFEVKSWEPVVSGATAGSGGGYFTLAAANAERKIDLSNGLTLTATLKVKSSAKSGDYDIKLTKSSLSYVTDNGYDYVELWSPSVKKVAVNVTAPTAVTTTTTTPAKTTTAKTTTTTTAPKTTTTTTVKTTTTTRPDNSTTPKVTTTTSKKPTITTTPPHPTGSPGFYTTPVRTTPATTTTKVKTTTAAETTAKKTTKKTTAKTTEDELFYDDEPDDEEENLDEPDIEDEIEISLSNKLKGISGKKASVSTKYRFFANNTKIILSNTDYADECAKVAAQNLRLEDYPYYAFDISVYDEVHGEYLKSLENDGYIELKLPLTEELSAATSELKVYHIETGYLELIESDIIFEDGVSKIVFRANSFSPYMIIDTVNKREPALITDVTTTTPTAGYVNPDTGAAVAITIPAALVGCVMLVKKNGRKRGRKG